MNVDAVRTEAAPYLRFAKLNSAQQVAEPLRCCRIPAGLPESGGVPELQPEEVGEGWQISFSRMPQRTASASNRW